MKGKGFKTEATANITNPEGIDVLDIQFVYGPCSNRHMMNVIDLVTKQRINSKVLVPTAFSVNEIVDQYIERNTLIKEEKNNE